MIDRLAQEDGQLLAHLVQATKEKGPSDPKEFLLNFIHSEKEQAQSLERSLSRAGFETLPKDAKDLLCHPIMFLRKWIGEVNYGMGCNCVQCIKHKKDMKHPCQICISYLSFRCLIPEITSPVFSI